MNKPYANFQKYRMNHLFKKNHVNRAKHTPLHVFPPLKLLISSKRTPSFCTSSQADMISPFFKFFTCASIFNKKFFFELIFHRWCLELFD